MNSFDVRSQPIGLMNELLVTWLDSEDSRLDQLVRWLQGYDLPDVGGADEPYILLLYGLPVGEDRYTRETLLAEKAAALLETAPDVGKPGKRPTQLLYNLLMLCAGLSAPDQLAEPLDKLFQRQGLNGRWRGIELSDALLAALIANQIDCRLRPVWTQMLEGSRHEFLPGSEEDGCEGMMLMPQSKSKRGEPFLEAIGYALKRLTAVLGDHSDRRPKFTMLLDRVQDLYFGHSNWQLDLLRLAHKEQWPTWAVECLPSLSIIIGDVESDKCNVENASEKNCKRLAVWWPFTKVLEAGKHVANFWYETEKTLCNHQVFQVVLPVNISSFIIDLASYVEPHRIDNPFPSSSSVVGNIADAMSAYELEETEHGSVQRRVIEEAHRSILDGL